MRARWWLRAGLILLSVSDAVTGAWAYLLPHSFYRDVPTVDLDPPFSQHLMSDVGAFYVSQAVVLIAAAVIMERRLVRVALAGCLTFTVLHLLFHVTHLTGKPAPDAAGLVVALALNAAVPAALFVVAGAASPRPHPERETLKYEP